MLFNAPNKTKRSTQEIKVICLSPPSTTNIKKLSICLYYPKLTTFVISCFFFLLIFIMLGIVTATSVTDNHPVSILVFVATSEFFFWATSAMVLMVIQKANYRSNSGSKNPHHQKHESKEIPAAITDQQVPFFLSFQYSD